MSARLPTPEPFESSGFSLVLIARAPVPLVTLELFGHLEQLFELPVEPVPIDPLPLGDRRDVLAALEQVEPIVQSDRIAAFEGDGVLKAVTPESGIVVVEGVDAPFYPDVASVCASVEDVRLHKAIQDHRAFVEVGVLGLDVVERPVDASRRACKLAARLCGPDVTAVAVPDRDLLACADQEILDALNSREPMVWPERRGASARRLADDDGAFDRAAAEARSRWSSFAEAFASRAPHDAFVVKVAVYEGDVCENLWFDVLRIDGDRAVECALQTQPIYLRSIRQGERRRFAVDAVLDWVHTAGDGTTVGGFTLS